MISREKLIALYSAMVKYRLLAARTEGKLPESWKLVPNLEAAVAAVTADLRADDFLISTQTKLASAFVNGSDCKDLLSPSNLRRTHAGNGHISSSTLAKEFCSALEAADTLKGSKGDAVSLLFCQTRMKSELWRKYLQRAGRHNLPIVLVRLAPATRRAHVSPGALAFGVPRIAVDANDALAVYRVASESIARARHRRGPTLIECLQITQASATDPLRAMELALARKRILNATLKQKIETGIRRDMNMALRPLVN